LLGLHGKRGRRVAACQLPDPGAAVSRARGRRAIRHNHPEDVGRVPALDLQHPRPARPPLHHRVRPHRERDPAVRFRFIEQAPSRDRDQPRGLIDEVLTGARVTLRPVGAGDEAVLTRIFSDPEVARWWGDPSKSVADAMETLLDESRFVIEHEGEAIGFIQCVEETEPMYEHASIDISLRSEWQGKGFGPHAIRPVARVLNARGAYHRMTFDPAAHNTRAINAYETVGFKQVGLMRSYE